MFHTVEMPRTLPALTDATPITCGPLGSPTARLSRADAMGLAVRLKALADPARLQLVDHLLDRPDNEDCTCRLAPVVGLSEPTTSHHLRQLLEAGLVTKRRDGMNVYYRLAPEAIDAVSRALVTVRR